jgi:phosphoglycolate phosphatase
VVERADLDALVFDFDGTLADSRIDFGLLRRRVLEYLTGRGLDPTPVLGHLVLEILAWGRAQVPPAAVEQYDREVRHVLWEVERPFAEAAEPFPGVPEALRRARDAGLRLGLITRNTHAGVDLLLARYPLPLAVVVTREDLERVKPDPEHLLLALRQLRVPPERAMLVGDHPTDIQCGRAAGAFTGAVLTSGQTEATFRALGADLIAPDVPTLIYRLLG